MPTHAHWVASWWSRAFTQISAQGTCNEETVTVSDLLVQFLNANRVAVQNTTRVGWEYDRFLWDDLSDRLRRREPDMDVRKMFKTVDNNQVLEAVSKVAEKVLAKTEKQTPTATRTPGSTGGKGKFGYGGVGFGSGGGGDWFGGKSGKGGSGFPGSGKGGGKDWGRNGGKTKSAKSNKAGKMGTANTAGRQVKAEAAQ